MIYLSLNLKKNDGFFFFFKILKSTLLRYRFCSFWVMLGAILPTRVKNAKFERESNLYKDTDYVFHVFHAER